MITHVVCCLLAYEMNSCFLQRHGTRVELETGACCLVFTATCLLSTLGPTQHMTLKSFSNTHFCCCRCG